MVVTTRVIISLALAQLLLSACRNQTEAREPDAQPVAEAPMQGPAPTDGENMAEATPPAPPPEEEQPAGPAPLPEADKTFALEAARSGMAEVELSKVALAGAKKAAIKELAQQMIDDHTKANEELSALVGPRGVDLPKEPDRETTDRKAALEKLKGTKLEKAYLDHMVADHRKAVELFRAQATNGADPELKQWAERTLPKLEDHLGHTEAVASGKKHQPMQVAPATPSGPASPADPASPSSTTKK